MCIVFFNVGQQEKTGFKLILAANRDEFLNRPAATASYWSHHNYDHVIAAEDLKFKAGTWFGITTSGKIAALTNVRSQSVKENTDKRSRGEIPTQYLTDRFVDIDAFLNQLLERSNDYNGYNLLVGDVSRPQIGFFSNVRSQLIPKVSEGLHGLSNGTLDEPWPKVVRGKQMMQSVLDKYLSTAQSNYTEHNRSDLAEDLFQILYDDQRVTKDSDLPQTGKPVEFERNLSSIFVEYPQLNYGTRSSAVVLVDKDDNLYFEERCLTSIALHPDGTPDENGDLLERKGKKWLRKSFTFRIH